jgi:hypothetical protein
VAEDRLGDLLGASRLSQELAQHGAQRHDDPDVAEGAPDTALERADRLGGAMPGDQPAKIDPAVRARKACILAAVISATIPPMPTRAYSSSSVSRVLMP